MWIIVTEIGLSICLSLMINCEPSFQVWSWMIPPRGASCEKPKVLQIWFKLWTWSSFELDKVVLVTYFGCWSILSRDVVVCPRAVCTGLSTVFVWLSWKAFLLSVCKTWGSTVLLKWCGQSDAWLYGLSCAGKPWLFDYMEWLVSAPLELEFWFLFLLYLSVTLGPLNTCIMSPTFTEDPGLEITVLFRE